MRGGWMTESWGKSDKAHHRLTKLRSWRWKNKLQKPAMGPGLVPEGKTDSGRNSVKKGCDRQCSLSAYLRITYRSDTSYRRIRKAIFRDNLLGRINPSEWGTIPEIKRAKEKAQGVPAFPISASWPPWHELPCSPCFSAWWTELLEARDKPITHSVVSARHFVQRNDEKWLIQR